MAATGTPTPNIGLRIPLGTDPASVDDINYNSNLLDTKLGAVGNDSVQDQIDTLNDKIVKSEIKQITTGADGIVVLSDYVFDKVVSITTNDAENRFCAIRKSSSGNIVIFVFTNDFQQVKNTTVNVRVWHIES